MNNKLIIFCALLLFYFTGCSQTKENRENIVTENKDSIAFKIDTSKIVVLSFENIPFLPVFENAVSAELTIEDYREIEILLEKCIEEYNINQKKFAEKHKLEKENINLPEYNRQYVPVINEYGEKEVWVNCFCGNYENSRRQNIVIIKDGGKCFFNVKINITKKEYYNLMVNGHA